MANTINRARSVNLGSGIYLLQFTIIGDGSGEETATRMNITTGDLGTNAKIVNVYASLSGFSARILADATTDEYLLQIPSDMPMHWDLWKIGGLNNSNSTGNTGDLLITTSGLGSTDSGTIIMEIRKS